MELSGSTDRDLSTPATSCASIAVRTMDGVFESYIPASSELPMLVEEDEDS